MKEKARLRGVIPGRALRRIVRGGNMTMSPAQNSVAKFGAVKYNGIAKRGAARLRGGASLDPLT